MAYKDISDHNGRRHSYRLEQLWNDLVDGLPRNIKNEIVEVTKGIAVPYELTFATEHDDKHNVNSIPFKFSIN